MGEFGAKIFLIIPPSLDPMPCHTIPCTTVKWPANWTVLLTTRLHAAGYSPSFHHHSRQLPLSSGTSGVNQRRLSLSLPFGPSITYTADCIAANSSLKSQIGCRDVL